MHEELQADVQCTEFLKLFLILQRRGPRMGSGRRGPGLRMIDDDLGMHEGPFRAPPQEG